MGFKLKYFEIVLPKGHQHDDAVGFLRFAGFNEGSGNLLQ